MNTPAQEYNSFRRPDSVPPGGVFFYEFQGARGEMIRFESYKSVPDLAWEIRSYLSTNQLSPISDLELKIPDFMCANLPPGFCWKDPDGLVDTRLTMRQVQDFTKILFERARRLGKGSFIVPKAEAERRAAICAKCPLNSKEQCTVCGGLLAFVRTLVGRRETGYDQGLGTCRLCGCMLRVKVHVSAESLRKAAGSRPPPLKDMPEPCWLREVYEYE